MRYFLKNYKSRKDSPYFEAFEKLKEYVSETLKIDTTWLTPLVTGRKLKTNSVVSDCGNFEAFSLQDAEIEKVITYQHSQRVHLKSKPFVLLNTKGNSYVNALAAQLLDLRHNDLLAIFISPDKQRFYLGIWEPGMMVYKRSGLYTFCDLSAIKHVFAVAGIEARRAHFLLNGVPEEIETDNQVEIMAYRIILTPYNLVE